MSTAIEQLSVPASARPDRISQATSVEQSRAVAEVQAAAVIARQNPRSKQRAVAEMSEECALPFVAERAFYRYRRGGENVTGGSIHLAKGLARCWQNIAYGTSELRRDDVAGESEMSAWAWDLEANNRVSITFTVKHLRDTSDGPVKLTSGRDIYEHLTNQANRRMREQIFAVLPAWFTDQASKLCTQTLEHGGGVALGTRVARMIAHYAEKLNVTQAQLERRVGRAADDWTPADLAELSVIGRAIDTGEMSVDAEFERTLTVADIVPTAQAAPAADSPQDPDDTAPPADQQNGDTEPSEPPPAQTPKRKLLDQLAETFSAEGWDDSDDEGKLAWLSSFIKSAQPITRYDALTSPQIRAAIDEIRDPSGNGDNEGGKS
ncbi:hypothetical protein OG579_16815 [Williamsia herbipolensis]|uniref:Uncharacterized protein n=1 Tax=Williamsia herbipolensis TaxID=1603258 RepID=A0AAU4JZY3_9NOCA|nr:hypothetical protein [Williamsia herbipolensis]